MTDKLIRLVDESGHMSHYSVEDMLVDALEVVRKNPEGFKNAYLLMREDLPDGLMDHHHTRAGFRDDQESLAYLVMGMSHRTDQCRGRR